MSEHQSSPEFQNFAEREFQSDPEINEVADQAQNSYEVDYIAKGGEHMVYDVKNHPGIVAKVNWRSIKIFLEDNAEQGRPLDAYPDRLIPKSKNYSEVTAKRQNDLKKYFGSKHVLSQRKVIVKIPVTGEIASKVLNQEQAETIDHCWAIVMIQRKFKDLEKGQHFDITAPYAEIELNLSEEEYEQVTQELLGGARDGSEFNKEVFFRLNSSKGLEEALELSESDPELRETLVDYVRKSISYSSDTDLPLDLVGNNNVVLYKDETGWNYKLLDALYPGNEEGLIANVKRSFFKISKGEELDDNELSKIYNTVHYTRMLNGLAILLGIPDRLNILPDGLKVEDIPFIKIMNKLAKHSQKKKIEKTSR